LHAIRGGICCAKNVEHADGLFRGPVLVGVVELVSDGRLTACKITFGAEPKDTDVYRFLLDRWNTLVFSPPSPARTGPLSL
jgi:hypothetical protein